MMWDKLVRITHWLNASLFLLAYFFLEEGELLHRWAGYTLLAVTSLRLVWGFFGSEYARFKHFFPWPSRVRTHWQLLRRTPFSRGSLPHYGGHNAFAALMIFFLWFGLISTVVTGWMQTLDYFWGDEYVELAHEWASDLTLVAAACHVLAVCLMSFWHNENLVRSMLWRKGD